ncbi:Pectinesterase [Heracleum sosnowskyi]|uniref:Pectinesterase n=1 Tax=Heracleum sosnowskyi TaxID=360622 RepID=A0AAD8IKR2_9APIA|nr:Pectinesterase [Heracleum sosnowskyi]
MGLSKKVTIIGLSSIVLVAVVVAVAVTEYKHSVPGDASGGSATNEVSTSNKAIKTVCQSTDYKDACVQSLSSSNSTDPKELIKTGFRAAMSDINDVISKSKTLQDAAKDPRTKHAYELCRELLSTSVDDLERSVQKLARFEASKTDEYVADLKTWLSGAIDYQETCIDAFQNTTGDAGEKMKSLLKTSSEVSSNGLAMVTELNSMLSSLKIPGFQRRLLKKDMSEVDPDYEWLKAIGQRRLFYDDYGPRQEQPPSEDPGTGAGAGSRRLFYDDYGPRQELPPSEDPGTGAGTGSRRLFSEDSLPEWMGAHQRSLLQANPKPNAVVALDGSGQFKSINDALKKVPVKNVVPFVILVKAGVYHEYIEVPRRVDNVVMIGEGTTKTKITGNKNFIDGVGTYKTSTVAVNGDGFMAKDIAFENSAGAAKHQAVALRVSGDRAIFYRCQMDGYQDTLYTHTYRQFYRDCTITGTIDFIFGDAAAVFQNCKMIVRKPMDNQGCMVTAQGRKDRRSTGGIILQNCSITAEPLFMQAQPPMKSYLGRPWKEYSRTIIMQSYIDRNIVPEGWSPWVGTFGMDTSYYVEFKNRGPGSDTSKRVTWKGIKKNLSPTDILQFTAGKFFQGDAWIPVAGIPYDSGMMKA